MNVRAANKTPPFILDDKRAIVRSLDHRGREQFGFGEARDVWINYALAPLAGGLTNSVDMRFVGGAFWYRVMLDRNEALRLLEQENGTEELRQVIESRYSLQAAPQPKVRMRCEYRATGRRCDREAAEGWTTCAAHHKHGGSREPAEEQTEPTHEYITDQPMPVQLHPDILMDGTILGRDDE